MLFLIAVCAFAFGLVTGSFLNVLIFRIPRKEEFVKTPSHCMSCGHRLAWHDLIPLFSWLFLRGKCRYCHAPVSKQYPLIELANGFAWAAVFVGCWLTSADMVDALTTALLWAMLCSALLALSVIDFRTYEIPVGFNVFIFALGIVHLLLHLDGWKDPLIGAVCVSLPLLLLFLLSKGRAIGGGDVKLMAACGFLLGWQKICFAFVVGCILGAVIHLIRMKRSDADHVLAMGPYLSMGLVLSLFLCDPFLNWYLSFLM